MKEECLTYLAVFYNEMTGLQDKRTAVVIVCLDFSKAFNTVPYNMLIHKLTKYGKWRVRWAGNWMNSWPQSIVINISKSRWMSVNIGVPQWSKLEQILCNIFLIPG